MSGTKFDSSTALYAEQMNRELRIDWGDRQTATLWHYTDAFGPKGILEKREIWATHYDFLNDRSELRHGETVVEEVVADLASASESPLDDVFRDFLQRWKLLRLSLITEVFVASFCADNGDRLSQWRGYGGAGNGYAIGFKGFPIFKEPLTHTPDADASAILVRVIYSEKEFKTILREELQRIARGVLRYVHTATTEAPILAEHAMARLLMQAATLALRYKHPTFIEEQEWRMAIMPTLGKQCVDYRPTPRGMVPYIEAKLTNDAPLDLEGVRLGPSHDPERGLRALRGYLTKLGYANANELALASAVPFRSS